MTNVRKNKTVKTMPAPVAAPAGEALWDAEEAKLEAMLPELRAVTPDEVTSARLPAFELVTSMRLWVEAAQGLYAEMDAQMKHPPTRELASMPGLLDVAEHLAVSIHPATQKSLKVVTENVLLPARKLLRQVIGTLAMTGHMSQAILPRAHEGRATVKVAKELIVLVGALRAVWNDVKGKVSIDMVMLDTTEAQAREALRMALQITAPAEPPTMALDRGDLLDRAIVLMLRRYAKIRIAVHFIRGDQGDADSFTPSPFRLRGGGRARKAVQTTDKATGVDGATPPVERAPDVTPHAA